MPNNMLAGPSAVSLFIQMLFNETLLATGTGFIVNHSTGPYLITNWHNVTGRHPETKKLSSPMGSIPNKIVIHHHVDKNPFIWEGRIEDLYVDERPRWREHPTLGSRADFIALPLTNLDNVDIYAYDISGSGPDILVGPADPVSVIGFPFGLSAGGLLPVWATGFLASEPLIDFNDLPIQLIDCRTRPGQSGSPVIAYRSGGMVAMADGGSAAFSGPVFKFIGIYSGRINADSDLGFVWKASAIQELMACL